MRVPDGTLFKVFAGYGNVGSDLLETCLQDLGGERRILGCWRAALEANQESVGLFEVLVGELERPVRVLAQSFAGRGHSVASRPGILGRLFQPLPVSVT